MHAKTQLDGWVEQMEFERDNEETIAAKAAEQVPELICYHCDASVPITEVNDHWRTCPKSPSRAEIERLQADNKRLRQALTQIMRRGDSMSNTPLGTQRQERQIWQGMTHIAVTALQAEYGGEG